MKTKKTACAQCSQPGFRFRGDRWLCLIHNRFETMMNAARSEKKVIPSPVHLANLASLLIADEMRCPHCRVVTLWHGGKGSGSRSNVISLQHDRSGRIRFLCCQCNSRHDDFPGDTFYDYPAGWKMCKTCKSVKPRSDFYPNTSGSESKLQGHCKLCQSVFFKERRRAARCAS